MAASLRCKTGFSRSPKALCLAILTSCCFASLGVQAQTFTSFDAPNAGSGKNQGTEPVAINQSGEIVGSYIDSSNALHGFVRSASGTITEFDAPGLTDTGAGAINSSGQIVGSGNHDSRIRGTVEGFLRSPSGTISGFQPPSALLTFPAGINDRGQIAGTYLTGGSVYHAFIVVISGGISSYTLFDEPDASDAPGHGTFVTGINASGEAAGYYVDATVGAIHGFTRDSKGNFTSFDAPGAGTILDAGTVPTSINRSGEMTGYYTDNNYQAHGFIRDAAGNFTDFDPSGSTGTDALRINDGGEIVGYWESGASLVSGFVRAASGALTSYTVPVPNTATYLYSVNDAGQMIGIYADLNGTYHGFVQ